MKRDDAYGRKNSAKCIEKSTALPEKPVEQLILSLCVPTIISMLITTIYNVADTFFAPEMIHLFRHDAFIVE